MADGVITVDLQRDGQATPWGFRLQGGKDVGLPLTIQRVFLGSPSEGELHRGDVICALGNKKADTMTHQEASDLFRKAGNNLRLVVHRSAMRSGSSTPLAHNFSASPLPHMGGGPITMYHFAASPTSGSSTPPPPLTKPGDYVFRPLPTTQFQDSYRPHTPDRQILAEDQEFVVEKHRERQSIVCQAHRTFPLISPQAKPRHDLPTGSYLRFVQDPSWKSPSGLSTASKVNEALMMAKLQDTVRSVAGSSVSSGSPGRTPTPDSAAFGAGPKVIHKQYNSPLNLYSAEAVTETLVGQASIEHRNSTSSVPNQPLPSPLIYTSTDIKRSPTYHMIHTQEWNDLRKAEMKEHNAVENRVYTVPPFGDGRFGRQDVIHQSGSFKNLMINVEQTTV